jgi:localization factor PodJL
MTGAAPWSVKGIDPKAREIAKDLARRSGMTLGDWLNQMIMEDMPPADEAASGAPPGGDRVVEALERLTARIETAEHRSTLAISGIDQSVVGLLSRIDGAERNTTAVAARFEGVVEEIQAEQARAAERLGRCEEQAAAPKALESLRSLEAALGKVAGQLYDNDGRTRESLTGLRADLDEVAGRVERIDQRAGGMADTTLIDGVVSRIVARLETAETRTSNAIRGLEASFADLDTRLRNTEHKNGDPEETLEHLAADLARRFEETRSELAARLHASADDRLEAIERSMHEMSEHVSEAERRSAQAIERMGHEVLRMAENLNMRMVGVEGRSTRAIEQVGGEVARIADTVEQRFRRADAIQAESLERLGGEIARITERLSERIGSSERRAAQAIDDVGEQMTRVTERITQRQERSSADIAERIRQSEERTARLLEEARERIDARMAETQRRLSEATAAAAPAAREPEDFELYHDDDLEPGPFARAAFGPMAEPSAAAHAAPAAKAYEPFHEPEPESAAPAGQGATFAATAAAFGEDDADFDVFAPADAFDDAMAPAPSTTAKAEQAPAGDDFDEPFAPAAEETATFDARRSGAREMIEQARAAARAAASREERSALATKASGGGGSASSLFGGLKLGKRKQRAGGSTLRTALMMSAAAAALGMTALGFTLITAQSTTRAEREHAARSEAVSSETPLAAVAVGPQSLDTAMVQPASAPASAEADALYADAVRRIEAKDFSALADLRRAANLGQAQAQFYLGKLYEGGEAGLKKDPALARQWTERAAQNGDRKAMHNLALYYFEGTGGPKNATAAAQWFRRASDLGLVDSQYNLARLYEEGFGVGRNPAEAYKWYLIAGRAGDAESRKSADRVKGQLSGDARVTAERAAASFRADLPAQPEGLARTMAAPALSGDLVLAQKALSQLGYYRGPQDGVSSPALQMAIAAYQKQQGLAPTGKVDAELAQRFQRVGG